MHSYPNYLDEVVSQSNVLEIMSAIEDPISSLRPCLVHGDMIPNNFSVVDGRLNLIDFSTLGMARPGFDEGRLWVHSLFAPEGVQQVILDTFSEQYGNNPGYLLYFWKTAFLRTARAIVMLKKGRYDKDLNLAVNSSVENLHTIMIISNLQGRGLTLGGYLEERLRTQMDYAFKMLKTTFLGREL